MQQQNYQPTFVKSTRRSKKYAAITPSGKVVHFGNPFYDQYKDSTGLGVWSWRDHGDKKRQQAYMVRAKQIRDKNGNITWQNPETANYYSVHYLWSD